LDAVSSFLFFASFHNEWDTPDPLVWKNPSETLSGKLALFFLFVLAAFCLHYNACLLILQDGNMHKVIFMNIM